MVGVVTGAASGIGRACAERLLADPQGLDSPWLRAILDMGNFIFEDDMYAAMTTIAPHVWLAHAKTYPGGGTWYTLDLDYARVFRTLLDAGFRGYCSIEMEGADPAETAVPQSIEMLQAAWAKAVAA